MTGRAKRGLAVLLPILICLAGAVGLSFFWAREYQRSVFRQISRFSQTIIENSPETRPQVLSALKAYVLSPGGGRRPALTEPAPSEEGEMPEELALSGRGETGDLFLTQYGYSSRDFIRGREGFLVLPMAAFFAAAAGLFVSAGYMDGRVRRRAEELTVYLEQVNTGAGGRLLLGQEDEFSHLQDELRKTVTELYETREQAVRARLNFADNLANIAHQLKTPITAALLSLQLMEGEDCVPGVKSVRRQLERLERLEESLLTLSKIDAGTLDLERTPVDVYTALNLAAENLGDLLEKEHITVDIPDRGCREIEGDLEWTMEAFMNLMKNCMEHSPQGGTIHCDYSAAPGYREPHMSKEAKPELRDNPIYTEILIWDEGEGFCEEDIPHLFERFYRGKRAAGEGIGIGLSLARSIFELQNGSVTARNLPGGGACFEIRVYSH